MKPKNFIRVFIIVIAILMIPFIAMRFTADVNWKIGDFLAAGILLLLSGFTIELLLARITNRRMRVILGLSVIIILILIWIDLAVGVFSMPWSGS